MELADHHHRCPGCRGRHRGRGPVFPAPAGGSAPVGPTRPAHVREAGPGTGTATAERPGTATAEPSLPPLAPGPPPVAEAPPPLAGRMMRLRGRLARSQSGFGAVLLGLLSRDGLDDQSWEEIEDTLIAADIGVAPSRQLVDELRTQVKVEGARGDAVKALLRADLIQAVGADHGPDPADRPARRPARGGADRRGERHRQDQRLRQARPRPDRGGAVRAAGRGGHLPRRRRRPAGDVGAAGGRPGRPVGPGGGRPGERRVRGGARGDRASARTRSSWTRPGGCTPRPG